MSQDKTPKSTTSKDSEENTSINNNSKTSPPQEDFKFSEVKNEHVEYCYEFCTKLEERLVKEEKEGKGKEEIQSLLEGAKQDYIIYIADNYFEDSELQSVYERFVKASNTSKLVSGIGKASLKSALKSLKDKRAKTENYEGFSNEMLECLEKCIELGTLSAKEQKEAKEGIWQFVFDKGFQDAEIEIIRHKVAESVSSSITAIKAEWKDAKARLVAEMLEEQSKEREKELGINLGPYHIVDRAFHKVKKTEDGEDYIPLCNFTAKIIREINYDDGAESKDVYRIEGNLSDGKALPPIEVLKEKYKMMNWVSQWRFGPLVYSGQTKSDDVRTVTHMYSHNVEYSTVYTHTGWRKIDSNWYYLHEGGAIGINEPSEPIEVDLGNVAGSSTSANLRLKDYNLAIKSNGELLDTETKEAIKASLELLKLGNTEGAKEVMFALLSAAYRVPLSESLTVDFGVFISGLTGTYKSQVTALVQAHFGAKWNGKHFPENWTSTANNLEKQAFWVKDALFTVDDYNPTGTQNQINAYAAKAEKVFRGQANQSGTGRLRTDTSARGSYYPRGLTLSSGEDIPQGHSLRARVVFLELKKGDIDKEKLSKAQKQAKDGFFVLAMRQYLKWLAPQIDELRAKLEDRLFDLRGKAYRATNDDTHKRLLEQLANLHIGFEMFLKFALELQVVTQVEHDKFLEDCWQTLIVLGKKQSDLQKEADPVNKFIELLIAALSTGNAYLADTKNGKQPIDPEKHGWNDMGTLGYQPQGDHVGWVGEEGQIYLQGDATYKVVQTFARLQGDNIAMSKNTLYKRMRERGMFVKHRGDGNTIEVEIQGNRKRAIYLDPSYLIESGGTGGSGGEGTSSNEGQNKKSASPENKVAESENKVAEDFSSENESNNSRHFSDDFRQSNFATGEKSTSERRGSQQKSPVPPVPPVFEEQHPPIESEDFFIFSNSKIISKKSQREYPLSLSSGESGLSNEELYKLESAVSKDFYLDSILDDYAKNPDRYIGELREKLGRLVA